MSCNSRTRQLDLAMPGEGMGTGVAQGMLFDCFALRYAALRSRTVSIVPVRKAWTFSTQHTAVVWSKDEADDVADLVNFLQEFAFLTETYQSNDMHISNVVVAVTAVMLIFEDEESDSVLIQNIMTSMKAKAIDMVVPFGSKTDPKGTILDPTG